MHSINSLLKNTKIEHLNLSSNMISEIGLEVIIDTLNKNTHLKSLDLGVIHNSIRKNSLGISGTKCIVSILLNN
jgi:Ran GTPase-activating protein (RanGAP) involved in mRNA processing and transport